MRNHTLLLSNFKANVKLAERVKLPKPSLDNVVNMLFVRPIGVLVYVANANASINVVLL